MFRFIAIFCLVISTVLASQSAHAKTKKKKKTQKSSHYRPTKHKRKSRRYHTRSNGPDLKTITTESPYKEDPTNGVTPIETKQPGL